MGAKQSIHGFHAKMMQAEATESDPNNPDNSQRTTLKDVIKNLPKDPLNNALYGLLMEKKHILKETVESEISCSLGDDKDVKTDLEKIEDKKCDVITGETIRENRNTMAYNQETNTFQPDPTATIPTANTVHTTTPTPTVTPSKSISSARAYAPKKRFRQRFEEPTEDLSSVNQSQKPTANNQGSSSVATGKQEIPSNLNDKTIDNTIKPGTSDSGSGVSINIPGQLSGEHHRSQLSPSTGMYKDTDGRSTPAQAAIVKAKAAPQDTAKSAATSNVVSMRTYMDEMMARMVRAPLPELEANSKIVTMAAHPPVNTPINSSNCMTEHTDEDAMKKRAVEMVDGKKPRTQSELIQQKIRDLLKDDAAEGKRLSTENEHEETVAPIEPNLSSVAPLTLIGAKIEAVMRQQPSNINSLMKQKKGGPTSTDSVSTGVTMATSTASSPSMSYPQLRLQLQGGTNRQLGSISKGTPSLVKSRPKYDPNSYEARTAHSDTVYSIVTNEIKQRVFNSSNDRDSTLSPDDLRMRSNSWSFNKPRYDPYGNNARNHTRHRVARHQPNPESRLPHTISSPERPASYHGPQPEAVLPRRQSLRDAYFEKQQHLAQFMNESRATPTDERISVSRFDSRSPHTLAPTIPRHNPTPPQVQHHNLPLPPSKNSQIKPSPHSPQYPRLESQPPTNNPLYQPGKELENMGRYFVPTQPRETLYADGRHPREHIESARHLYDRQRREEDMKPGHVTFQPMSADRSPHSFGSITRGTPRTGPAVSDHQRESILNEAYQIQSSMPPRSHFTHHMYDKTPLDTIHSTKKPPPAISKPPPPLLPLTDERFTIKEDYSRPNTGSLGHLHIPERERSRSRSPVSRDNYGYPSHLYPSSRHRGNSSEHPLDLSKKEQKSLSPQPIMHQHNSNRYPAQRDKVNLGPMDKSDQQQQPPPLEKIYKEEWLKHYTLPAQVEKQLRKEDNSQNHAGEKEAQDWSNLQTQRPVKHYDHPGHEAVDNRHTTGRMPSELNPELEAAARAQMLAAYGAPPFPLIYSMVNPALYAVHSNELFKAPSLSMNSPRMSPSKLDEGHHSPKSVSKMDRSRPVMVNLLGNHPPDDVLLLKCNLCMNDYGNVHSFTRHFHRDHSKVGEPQQHHVTIKSISKAKNEKAAAAAQSVLMMMDREKPGYEPETDERHIMDKPHHSIQTNVKNPMDNNSVMKCFLCGQEFPTRDWGMFRRHMRSHEQTPDSMNCTECHVAFRDRNEWQLHMSLCHKNHTCVCKVCNVGFAHIDAMYKHVHSVHSGLNNVQVEFCCLHCNKSFNNERDLSEHRQIHDLQGRGSPGAHVSMSVRARVKDQEVSMSPPPNIVHRVTPDTTCKEETRLPSSEPEMAISRSDCRPEDTMSSYRVNPSKPSMLPSSFNPESQLAALFPGNSDKVSFFEMLQQKVEDEHRRQGVFEPKKEPPHHHHVLERRSHIEEGHNGKVTEMNEDSTKLFNNLLKRKMYEDHSDHVTGGKLAKYELPPLSSREKVDLDNHKMSSRTLTADTIISGIVESALAESGSKSWNDKDEIKKAPDVRALMSSLLSSFPRVSPPNFKHIMEVMGERSKIEAMGERPKVEVMSERSKVEGGESRPNIGVNQAYQQHKSQFTDSDLIAATVLAEISGSVGAEGERKAYPEGGSNVSPPPVNTLNITSRYPPQSHNLSVQQTDQQQFSPSMNNHLTKGQFSPPMNNHLTQGQFSPPMNNHHTKGQFSPLMKNHRTSSSDKTVKECESIPSVNDKCNIEHGCVSKTDGSGESIDNHSSHSPSTHINTAINGATVKNSAITNSKTESSSVISDEQYHHGIGEQDTEKNTENDTEQEASKQNEGSYSPKSRVVERMESYEDSPLVIAWDEESDKDEKSD